MTALQINTNQELDVPLIYQFLSEQSTWAVGMPRALLERYRPNIYAN